MPANVLADRQYGAPADADGVTLVAPGGSWTYGDWVPIVPVTDAAFVLNGITLRPDGALFDGYDFEVQIGVGDEGDEAAIANYKGIQQQVVADIGSECLHIPNIIGIDAIPLGSRVSGRWRVQNAVQDAFLSFSHYKKPIGGTLLTTTSPLLCEPFGANCLSVATSATAWVPGANVELLSGISAPARTIVGVVTHISSAGVEWRVDLVDGDDNVLTSVRPARGGVSSFPNNVALPHPLTVPADTTVYARSTSEDNGIHTVAVGVMYFEL